MSGYDGINVKPDIDEIYAVNNKDIVPPKEYTDVVVKGDNKSNSLFFKINRYVDSIDLLGKTFQIYYINADGYSDIAAADKIIENEEYIIFTWRMDSNVTHTAGKVRFIIKISGTDYLWKSKPCSINVVDTLDDTAVSEEYESSWISDTESRLNAIEEKISEILARLG